MPFEEEGQADVLPASQGDAELTSLIADDPSITSARSKGKPMEHRLEVLRLTLSEALKAWTKDWPKEEAELAKYDELTGIVSEAIASAKEPLQAKLSREDSSKLPAHYFGQSPTNMLVVARTLLKIKQNPAAPAKKPGKSQDIQAPNSAI